MYHLLHPGSTTHTAGMTQENSAAAKVLSKGSRFTSKEWAQSSPSPNLVLVPDVIMVAAHFLKDLQARTASIHGGHANSALGASALAWAVLGSTLALTKQLVWKRQKAFYLIVSILPAKLLQSFPGHAVHPASAEGSFAAV